MFAVIFETSPNPERIDQYLEIATALRPELLKIDGFIENERFRRDDKPQTLLSLSFWRDEKSLIRWRTQELHHNSQAQGRAGVLSDYRLRVGEVVLSLDQTGLNSIAARRADSTDSVENKFVTVSLNVAADDLADIEALRDQLFESVSFHSINQAGSQLLLVSWQTAEAGEAWLTSRNTQSGQRHFAVNVIRHYGIQDRYEAPSYHLPIK